MDYQVNTVPDGSSWVRLTGIRLINGDCPTFPGCLVLWGEDKETPVAVFPLAGVVGCFQPEALAEPPVEQGTGMSTPEAKAAPFYPGGGGISERRQGAS